MSSCALYAEAMTYLPRYPEELFRPAYRVADWTILPYSRGVTLVARQDEIRLRGGPALGETGVESLAGQLAGHCLRC